MKWIMSFLLIICIGLVGCGTNGALQDDADRNEVPPQLDPNTNQSEPSETRTDLGFVRYTKEEFANDEDHEQRSVTVDRREMADMITRIILQNNLYEEVVTLVTDEEVLIAFEHTEAISEEEAMVNARKTAESIVPRYYDIYSSADETLIQNLQTIYYSLSNNPDFDYDESVQKIITEMQQDESTDDE